MMKLTIPFSFAQLVLLLVLSVGFLTVGCEKDVEGCTDPAAETFNPDANIDDGTCIYARDKFLGTYQVTEACTSGDYSYSIIITESSTSIDAIVIGNFGNFSTTVNLVATVNSSSDISFQYTQDGVTFAGGGTLTGNTMTLTYQASGGFTDSCTMTCLKQ
jgi:hypothetical protein